jgi:hypothetical protein
MYYTIKVIIIILLNKLYESVANHVNRFFALLSRLLKTSEWLNKSRLVQTVMSMKRRVCEMDNPSL